MEQKSFFRAFLEGFKMGCFVLFPPKMLGYEKRFGTDEKLIASDWQAIGDDLGDAMRRFEKDTGGSPK